MKKKILIPILVICAIALILFLVFGKKGGVTENKNDANKNQKYIDTITSYVDQTKALIDSNKIKPISKDTLYLIPVGSSAINSCVKDEVSGLKWVYAYVGVTNDDDKLNYFFVGKEGKKGFNLVNYEELKKDVSKYFTDKPYYAIEMEYTYGAERIYCVSDGGVCGTGSWGTNSLKEAIKEAGSNIKTVSFIGIDSCK